jgi:hypothetical protein
MLSTDYDFLTIVKSSLTNKISLQHGNFTEVIGNSRNTIVLWLLLYFIPLRATFVPVFFLLDSVVVKTLRCNSEGREFQTQ